MRVKYFAEEGYLICEPQVFTEPEMGEWSEPVARDFAASQLRLARQAGAKVRLVTNYLWKITFPPGRLAASGLLKITEAAIAKAPGSVLI